MKHINIAIDGPSGAGKSSLAKTIAKELGIIYVDTGALYRTVGYYAKHHGVYLDDAASVVDLLSEIDLDLLYNDGVQTVMLNGEDVSSAIRMPEISLCARQSPRQMYWKILH